MYTIFASIMVPSTSNKNTKLFSTFRKQYANRKALRYKSDIAINDCGFMRLKDKFCVSTRMEQE